MGDVLNQLTDDWNCIDSIILYGAGTVLKICEDIFCKVNLNIEYVIDADRNKQGKTWNNIPIVSYEMVEEKIRGKKIVVMAAHVAYNDISQILISKGFIENRDFCRAGQFLCEWFWKAKGMNCIYHVDMTVTTRCTFNCQNCNMFIPYYENKCDMEYEQLIHNIDLLFHRVDYVVYFGLIGGEPMLNQRLDEVITYLCEKYRNKFGRISYASNGSVIPPDRLLNVMKKYDVHIVVSDYSDVIDYKNRLDSVQKKFDKFGISYDIKPSIVWCDFGFPQNPISRTDQQFEAHIKQCTPEWNGLNDGKFYYCNISWSAEKCGKFRLQESDYLELEKINCEDKVACHQIVELSRNASSFCRVCGGCGNDNTVFVQAGIQN